MKEDTQGQRVEKSEEEKKEDDFYLNHACMQVKCLNPKGPCTGCIEFAKWVRKDISQILY